MFKELFIGLFDYLIPTSDKPIKKSKYPLTDKQKKLRARLMVNTQLRNAEMVVLFETGDYSLEDLGRKYGVTRERARQICALHCGGSARRDITLSYVHKKKEKNLIKQYGSLEKFQEETERLARERVIKKERAEQGAWHWRYDACVDCGTTSIPHKSHGRCNPCLSKYLYHNLPGRKESHKKSAQKWFAKNKEKVYAHQREYFKEYSQRPDVKEKLTKRYREYRKSPEGKEHLNKYHREYYSRPEVKARLAVYNNRPEIKARRNERQKIYMQTPEHKKAVIDSYHVKMRDPEYAAKRKAYNKEYGSRPDVKAKILLNRKLNYEKRKRQLNRGGNESNQ